MADGTIEEAIKKILIDGDPGAMVSNRVYPTALPQNPTLPAIVYQKIDAPRYHSHSGASGLASPRFQFRTWSTTYGEAKRIANAIRTEIDGKSFPEYTLDDGKKIDIQSVLLEDETDDFDENSKHYSTRLDFVVWHAE